MACNPNANGEIWVTVVATGLSSPRSAAAAVPTVQPQQATAYAGNPRVAPFIKPLADVEPRSEPAPIYAQRQPLRAAGGGGSSFPIGLDEDIINIPAFLRNQAD
jgi:cell division protein FtsZ